jgi:hypothetical protein
MSEHARVLRMKYAGCTWNCSADKTQTKNCTTHEYLGDLRLKEYDYNRRELYACLYYIVVVVFAYLQRSNTCHIRSKDVTNFIVWTEIYGTQWRYFFFFLVAPALGSLLPVLEHRAEFPQFLDQGQTVGLLGRVISSSQGLYLYTNTDIKHSCPDWDAYPRSRLPSERRQYTP